MFGGSCVTFPRALPVRTPDQYYKKQYDEAKKKKNAVTQAKSDKKKQKEKEDVKELIAKTTGAPAALGSIKPLSLPSPVAMGPVRGAGSAGITPLGGLGKLDTVRRSFMRVARRSP